jgi:hypothetical protein
MAMVVLVVLTWPVRLLRGRHRCLHLVAVSLVPNVCLSVFLKISSRLLEKERERARARGREKRYEYSKTRMSCRFTVLLAPRSYLPSLNKPRVLNSPECRIGDTWPHGRYTRQKEHWTGGSILQWKIF